MSESQRKKQREIAEGLTAVLADSGRLIEVGFEIHANFYLTDATPEQRETCRECYMMGAHHTFSSVLNALDDSTEEPTDRDLRRMTLAYEELEAFVRHFKRRHKVADDIYPQPPIGTKQ